MDDRETWATLQYVTDHAYFWIQDNVDYKPSDLETLARTFETVIYPVNRDFFGSEWTPGVDGDPHLYVVYAADETNSGSFPPYAELNPVIEPDSDAHEIIFLSADNGLSDPYTYGVLAHEFQHAIHFNVDRNEESWLEEGFSELAAFRLGYELGSFDETFANHPDVPMIEWPDDGDTSSYYGSGALFNVYFLHRFGEAASRALVADPRNGIQSLQATLADLGIVDPLTGQPVSIEDVYRDFAVALYLQDASVADGRYTIGDYQADIRTVDTETIRACPGGLEDRQVHQFGIDYIGIECPGDYVLDFSGETGTYLLPASANPHSGSHAFWSNRGVNSDMTLTCTFDFTNSGTSLSMNYWTWYDIEDGYDYVYVEALGSGEIVWRNLRAASPSDFYAGYTGSRATWQEQTVDLSAYAGKMTQVRFEYVTDGSINRNGFLVDDISIPAIGYSTDFESGPDCWQAAGFVRVQNLLPQTYRVALVIQGKTGTTVQNLLLDANQAAQAPLHLENGERAMLVVLGTTRYGRAPAGYDVRISP
jgi:hypothetical protein